MTRRRRRSGMVKLMSMTPEQWANLTAGGTNPIAYEIKRIEEMEKEAWFMYHAHGGEIKETETIVQVDSEGDVISETTKTKERNDPRIAMNWFDRIISLQEKRLAMLNFDAKRAAKVHKMMAAGDYEGFDPETAWPVPGMHDSVFEDAVNEE